MKEKYIRPQIINSDVGKDTAILSARIKIGAIPSHKLENLPKRKD